MNANEWFDDGNEEGNAMKMAFASLPAIILNIISSLLEWSNEWFANWAGERVNGLRNDTSAQPSIHGFMKSKIEWIPWIGNGALI